MAVIKRQVYGHLDSELGAALENSLRLMSQSLTTEDFREGVASYVEQRPPRFRPLNA
jgi:enoyl-CoA hydratase/carnithine racemase